MDSRYAVGSGLKRIGSIPARAGEPSSARCPCSPLRVYPRACGGTADGGLYRGRVAGLSPRVRGNPPLLASRPDLKGSIPARAGEPACTIVGRCHLQVYPRACGGTADDRPAPSRVGGLSPRVRGNHRNRVRDASGDGSIPTRAGEPSPPVATISSERVYPRACGGTSPIRPYLPQHEGLSPRVRGNRVARAADEARAGSIPARAGEP